MHVLNTECPLTPGLMSVQAEELEKKLKFISEKVPNRIVQVMGSNAGAGSGEFHMYRMVKIPAPAIVLSSVPLSRLSVNCSDMVQALPHVRFLHASVDVLHASRRVAATVQVRTQAALGLVCS